MKKLFLVLVVFAYMLYGQESEKLGNIAGKVIDSETKQLLFGATVTIDGTVKGATTDNNGEFVIKNLSLGNHSVRVSFVGYETVVQPDVQVAPQKTTFITLETKTANYNLSDVVINGGYFKDTEHKQGSVVNFSAEEIRRSPGTAGDVSRIMFTLPSVSKVNDVRNSLAVRGGSSVENSYYLDNIEIPNINHFPVEGSSDGPIGLLNPEFIQDVNFYSGGFSAAYGDRLSSIMEIDYREGNKEEIVTKLALGLTGIGASIEGPLSNSSTFMISANRSYLDVLIDQFESGGALPKYGDGQVKLTFQIDDKNKLTFLNILSIDDILVDKEAVIKERSVFYGNSDQITNTAGLNWMHVFGSLGYTNTSVSYTYNDAKNKYYKTKTLSEMFRNDFVDHSIRVRNVTFLKLNEWQNLEVGFDLSGNNTAYKTRYNEYKDQWGNTIPTVAIDKTLESAEAGAFASHSIKLLDLFTLNYGVRADYYTYNEKFVVAPRASLIYHYSPITNLSFSFGKFYQNNPNNILIQSAAFKKLDLPQSTHFILGLHHYLGESTKLTIEAYYKDYDNLTLNPTQPTLLLYDQPQTLGGFWNQTALTDKGIGISRGIEVTLQKKLASDFYGIASVSLSKTRYKDFNGTWRDRIYDNQFNVNIEGGYIPGSDWEFKLRWIYAGGTPYTPVDVNASLAAGTEISDLTKANSVRLPDYHSLNLRVDKKFYFGNSSLLLYLSVWNVYNRENIGVYFWNDVKNELETVKQWSVLPVVGLEYQF